MKLLKRQWAQLLVSCQLSLLISGDVWGASISTPTLATSVGPVQVLQSNDLSASTQAAGALALLSLDTYQQGATKCASLAEGALPVQLLSSSDLIALQTNLAYLISQKLLGNASFWVDSPGGSCTAINGSTAQLSTVACTSTLYTLCTSTAPMTTDASGQPDDKYSIEVQTQDGWQLTGTRDARSFRFLGIPYADAPVGNLRFSPPQAYSGSKSLGVRTKRDACPQPLTAAGSSTGNDISEDCLFLNIFTPFLPAADNGSLPLKPVGFFIYGGRYYTGSGGLIDYDGQNFASRNDIILVTLNYRLGALGFLATDSILNGNQAIHDQLMALQWVRDHIAAFGGDPNHITIFGQSAGAQSVTALLSSITPNTAEAVGCTTETEAAMVACLRQVPYTSLIANTTAQQVATAVSGAVIGPGYFKGGIGLGLTEYYLPIVGGGDGVIDGQFVDLLSHGTLPNKVPTMFTEVRDEAYLFVDKVAPPLGSSQLTLDLVQLGGYSFLEATAMTISGQFRVNSSASDGVRNELAAMLTQSEFLCPHGYILDNYAKVFPQVWHAVLDKGHPLSDDPDFSPAICNDGYVCHTADLLPIFGTLNVKTKDAVPYYSSDEHLYFQVLNDIWSSFLRTHNPTPSKSYLQLRGSTFSATLNYFYGQSASLPFQPYNTYNDTNILGYDTLLHRPSRWQSQCQGFFDKYGYTFQRV
ncbi:hypothetical protein EX895_001543 [Sporisorium graminicola]|uniref:Carboxylic ester hydrolase n=1 Tax=Sporisorium graminicola TaxID=280036 RepID=A0A4U7L1U0_9BASI|nr:hypothetical protein EX895_001543 [Sporisorium graminicola]TKY89758.1 hypothetical protein EX895_001543 [Sporisorium graminicola]